MSWQHWEQIVEIFDLGPWYFFFWKKIILIHDESQNSAVSLWIVIYFFRCRLVRAHLDSGLLALVRRRRSWSDPVHVWIETECQSVSQEFVFLENLYTKQYSQYYRSKGRAHHITSQHTAVLGLGLGITAWTRIKQEVANLIWKHREHATGLAGWLAGGGQYGVTMSVSLYCIVFQFQFLGSWYFITTFQRKAPKNILSTTNSYKNHKSSSNIILSR